MTAAIVLAAGRSERMGRSKAGIPLPSGVTFLEAILDTLERVRVETVRIVVGPESAGHDTRRAEVVVNPDPSRGMLSSVQCGLQSLPGSIDAVLLWPVDHPRVGAGVVATLMAAHRAQRVEIVVPVHDGRRGHPVLFAGAALAQLAAAPAGGTARTIVHESPWRIEVPVGDPAISDDIDEPADYERIFGRALPAEGTYP